MSSPREQRPPSRGKPSGPPRGSSRRGSAQRPASRPAGKPAPERPRTDDRPPRPPDPAIPDEITGEELDRTVLAELRTLPEEIAHRVARLLVAASEAIDDDPAEALEFARAAKRRAARVAPVREALAWTAYAAGEYAEALGEFRAVRRMTGDDTYVPVMADCERGLGRPRKALDLLGEVDLSKEDPATRAEARIVAAGARRDLGSPEAALVLLQVPALKSASTADWVGRLRYAYADCLAELGRDDEAREWFTRVLETEAETDAADRLGGSTNED